MKKIIICALMLTLVTLSACTSRAESVFKTDANNYFKTFEDSQTGGKNKTDFQFDKEKGSVALSYAVTGNKTLDAKIKDYCDSLVAEFNKTSQKGDSIYISYRSFEPAKDIFGVAVHSKKTVGEKVSEEVEIFNMDKDGNDPVTTTVKRACAIEGRNIIFNDKEGINTDKLKKVTPKTLLFAKTGVEVTFDNRDFDGGDGETTVTVDYTMLYNYLPKALQDETPKPQRFVDITKKLVAVTYDDGPHNTYSNRILDTLEEHGCVATFFEVGNLVEQGADTIKRAEALGCEIASHTWSHANLQTSSQSVIDSQIEKADEAIEDVIGKKPALLRPPYGATDKELLANCDKYLIGWSVDTNDWKYRDADKVFGVIKNEGDLDGDVILMHSLYDSTAKATERIVPYLVDKGYQLVTISELIKYKNEDFLETGKYYTYNYFG